jgi:oligopeptidase B
MAAPRGQLASVIYAIAHVRGGGQKGDPWHDAGRLANKLNTFTVEIAVVEHLIRLRMAQPCRIVAWRIRRRSLVGAAVNVRPDLFGAVYAEVPFVDCLNTPLEHAAAHRSERHPTRMCAPRPIRRC